MANVSSSSRLTQLDGLRGVAALVVLLCHTAATIPAMGGAYFGEAPSFGSVAWWFTYSPLKLFTSGSEAVLIFFVLSGFVVSLPSVKFGARGWLGYYPQRLIRLGVPFLAALAVGWIAALALPRVLESGMSPWLAGQQIAPTLHSALKDMLLLNPAPALNNPLWSIRWEIIFSLALPLYSVLARAPQTLGLVLLPVSVIAAGAALMFGQPDIAYLLLFAIGALINPVLPLLVALSSRSWTGSGLLTAVFGGAATILLIGSWLTRSWTSALPIVVQALPTGLSVLGATGLVLLAIVMRPAARVLQSRFAQFFGKISFSLYLVHVPIVASVAFFAPSALAVTLPLVALPVALAIALLFSRFVEGPSHRLSQRVGRAVRARPSALTVPAVAGAGRNH